MHKHYRDWWGSLHNIVNEPIGWDLNYSVEREKFSELSHRINRRDWSWVSVDVRFSIVADKALLTSAAYVLPSIVCSEPRSLLEPQCRWNCSRRQVPSRGPPLISVIQPIECVTQIVHIIWTYHFMYIIVRNLSMNWLFNYRVTLRSTD